MPTSEGKIFLMLPPNVYQLPALQSRYLQPRSQGFSLGDLARAGIAKGKALGTRLRYLVKHT